MVKAIPGRNLPVLNFSNHLSKPWTDPRFARSKWVVYPSSQKIGLESKVDSKRNSDFPAGSGGTFPGATDFWKGGPVFPDRMFQSGIRVPSLKAMFDTSFRLSRPFFVEWNWFGQMVNAIPRRNLPVLNFASQIRSNKNRRKAIFNWAAKGLVFLRGGDGYTHLGYHKTLSATIACDRTSCETET